MTQGATRPDGDDAQDDGAAQPSALPLYWRLAVVLLRWASRLPFERITQLGRGLGWLLHALAGSRKRVGRRNLELCFPAMPAAERERLLKAHFVALAQMVLEYGYCWFAPRDAVERLVRIEGAEHLHRSDGRPVILSMPHFTGLDLVGLRLSLETPIVSVYSRQKHPALDALVRQGRLRFDSGIVFPRQAGIRPIIKAMRSGLPLYYLPDLDHGLRDAVFADFFGVPAATLSSLSRLAAVTNAVVLPCHARRDTHGYTAIIEAPLADFPGADLVQDAQRINHIIERQVLQKPHQYYWLHRRFKTRPPGAASLY